MLGIGVSLGLWYKKRDRHRTAAGHYAVLLSNNQSAAICLPWAHSSMYQPRCFDVVGGLVLRLLQIFFFISFMESG